MQNSCVKLEVVIKGSVLNFAEISSVRKEIRLRVLIIPVNTNFSLINEHILC